MPDAPFDSFREIPLHAQPSLPMNINRLATASPRNHPKRVIDAMPADAPRRSFGENARKNKKPPFAKKPRLIALWTIHHLKRILRALHDREAPAERKSHARKLAKAIREGQTEALPV